MIADPLQQLTERGLGHTIRRVPRRLWELLLVEFEDACSRFLPPAYGPGNQGHVAPIARAFRLPFECGSPMEVRRFLQSSGKPAGQAVLAEGERLLQDSFELFGTNYSFHRGVDWSRDICSGYSWPRARYAKKIRFGHLPGVDIKGPWELSRFAHGIRLGQASWMTGETKYAAAWEQHVQSWWKQCPPQRGVNWSCAMEVAIRAIHWIWTYRLTHSMDPFTPRFPTQLAESLWTHGQFLTRNLEKDAPVVNNHYLANLVGLLYLGLFLRPGDIPDKWLRYAVAELEQECMRQVYPDGVNFEGSTSYHRLAVELFTTAAWTARTNAVHFTPRFWERLADMYDFVRHALKPSGRIPQFGDNDSGRIHPFVPRPVLDHRYLLSHAAILFEDSRYKSEEDTLDAEAVWFFGGYGIDRFQRLPAGRRQPGSRGYPAAGFYFLRDGDNYLGVCAADNGQNGVGGHSHNDKLSFELSCAGDDFLVDPGTYVYTADPEWRNRFRSTAFHNTVRIDAQEQNRIMAGRLFYLVDDARVTVRRWQTGPTCDILEAHHTGYGRLAQPITHRRLFVFRKEPPCWMIHDALEGSGDHLYEWFFHFAPEVTVSEHRDIGTAVTATHAKGNRLHLIPWCHHPLVMKIRRGWFSPEYGVKRPAPVVSYRLQARAPVRVTFILGPARLTETASPQTVIRDLQELAGHRNDLVQ